LLQGIERFETRPGDTVVKGIPVRLRHIALHVAESKLGGPAEVFLLGAVVDHLLQSFGSINSLHRFSILGTETNVSFSWPARAGTSNHL